MGRDKHEQRRRRSKKKFVQIWHEVIESAAYQSLSVYAKAALVEICNRYNGVNNGKIPFSLREMRKRLGTGQHQVAAALRALVEHGLIAVEHLGWFSSDHCHSTEWRITFQPTDKPATNEFRNWKPDSAAGAAALAQSHNQEPKKQNPAAGAAARRCRTGSTSAVAKMDDRCRSGSISDPPPDAGAAAHVHSSQGVDQHTGDLGDAGGGPAQPPNLSPDPRMSQILAAVAEMVADGATNELILVQLDQIVANLATAGRPLPSSARQEVADAVAAARRAQHAHCRANKHPRPPAGDGRPS
jgi:hypothetical protein